MQWRMQISESILISYKLLHTSVVIAKNLNQHHPWYVIFTLPTILHFMSEKNEGSKWLGTLNSDTNGWFSFSGVVLMYASQFPKDRPFITCIRQMR